MFVKIELLKFFLKIKLFLSAIPNKLFEVILQKILV